MMSLHASACAKFILGGEHSIVSRGRAIAFPLPLLRLNVEIFEAQKSFIDAAIETAHSPQLWINQQLQKENELKLIQELCLRVGAHAAPRQIRIDGDIPIGAGLGSSAALCTALARVFQSHKDPFEIAQIALEGEKLFHRNPSGIDPFTIALEKAIIFRGSDKSWRPCSIKAAQDSDCRFLLFSTGQQHKTAQVQKAVEQTKASDPLIYDDLMDALSTNVEKMIESFEAAKLRELGKIMNDSHFRLIQLGVSSDSINDLTEKISTLPGCLGAKITGAGCGGYVLALFESPGSNAKTNWYHEFEAALPTFQAPPNEALNSPMIFEWRSSDFA